jgi:hypothetical protein
LVCNISTCSWWFQLIPITFVKVDYPAKFTVISMMFMILQQFSWVFPMFSQGFSLSNPSPPPPNPATGPAFMAITVCRSPVPFWDPGLLLRPTMALFFATELEGSGWI